MRFCREHLKLCQRELGELGLGELLPTSSDEYERRYKIMSDAVRAGELPEVYDPLIDLVDGLNTFAVKKYGPELLEVNEAGHHLCPVCVAERRDKVGVMVLRNMALGVRHFAIKHGYLKLATLQ